MGDVVLVCVPESLSGVFVEILVVVVDRVAITDRALVVLVGVLSSGGKNDDAGHTLQLRSSFVGGSMWHCIVQVSIEWDLVHCTDIAGD